MFRMPITGLSTALSTTPAPPSIPVLSIIVLSLLALTACGNNQQTSETHTSETHNAPLLKVTDFTGRDIKLSQPAQRIIALAPHVVENVFSVGAGDKLAGVVAYSNFPEQAKSLPVVGGYEQINHEKILALNPDLIIAWESGNSFSSVTRLIDLGFTVYIDQPDNLKDIAKSLRDIGILTGNQSKANKVANNYLTRLAQFNLNYINSVKVTTFYQVWDKPLQSINGKHIISDAIETCGGVNIYADEFAVAPVINIESILERNPEVIIASGMSSARPEWLDEWKTWPSLTAVQKDNLFFVHPDHIQRHTVRLLNGLASLCAQLDLARQRLNHQ